MEKAPWLKIELVLSVDLKASMLEKWFQDMILLQETEIEVLLHIKDTMSKFTMTHCTEELLLQFLELIFLQEIDIEANML
jgi:hypothetical protein